MIKVQNIYKKYYIGKIAVPVLNGVDLEIEKGEYVLVTGRSGAGKSTLLYLLGLFDEPTQGKIFINHTDTSNLSEQEKSAFRLMYLGYVFQDYALLPELTAWENIAVPLLMRGQNANKAKEQAKEALKQVGLEEKIDNLPNQLSGGQQQRVSIARAIASSPKIVFADEPTANLDSKTAEQVMDTFYNINKNGQTIVMVTHELKQAKGAKRIIHLDDGKIINKKIGN